MNGMIRALAGLHVLFYCIGKCILSYTIKKARGAGEVVFPAAKDGHKD